MPRNPVAAAAGPAGLVLTALLILTSCGDDSGSVPVSPTNGESAPADSAPASSDTVVGPDATGGADRSGELVGSWEIVNYTLSDSGSLTNVVGDVTPFVEFRADGTVAFQTGCNGGSATWEASGTYVETTPLDDEPEGQPIQVRDVVTEQAACDGFLGDQDADIATHLAGAERFLLTDDGGMSLLAEFVLIIGEPS